jgi:hypothetical protein
MSPHASACRVIRELPCSWELMSQYIHSVVEWLSPWAAPGTGTISSSSQAHSGRRVAERINEVQSAAVYKNERACLPEEHDPLGSYGLTAGEIDINERDKSKSTGDLYPAGQLVINKEGELQFELLKNSWQLLLSI